MPDISMCTGEDCPQKETCYRFKARPNDYQSYFNTPPINKETKECEYHTELYKSKHHEGTF